MAPKALGRLLSVELPQPRAVAKRRLVVATAGMIAAIASVPFWEDSDAAPLLFGAAAGFVARTVIRFRRWPT